MERVLPVPFTPINIITTGFLLCSINSLKSKSLVFKTWDIAFFSTVSTKSLTLDRENDTFLISSLMSFFMDSITEYATSDSKRPISRSHSKSSNFPSSIPRVGFLSVFTTSSILFLVLTICCSSVSILSSICLSTCFSLFLFSSLTFF